MQKWNDINDIWKEAISLAWESFKSNTIPIGAVIVDENGTIVSKGRNMVYDTLSSNLLSGTNMAHAEMTAMAKLKLNEHPDIRRYTLYTTMEPCPMCFGAMVMMNIRDIRYASRDGMAGAAALNQSLEYIVKKDISITKEDSDLEYFLICLQTTFECIRQHTKLEELLSNWRQHCHSGVETGIRLYETRYFQRAVQENRPIGMVFNEVMEKTY